MQRAFILVLIAISGGCSTRPHVVEADKPYSGKGKNEVYVVSHGWHTGFVIPGNRIYKEVPDLKSRFGNTQGVEFGWGDRAFYQSEEITSGLVLRAILWPTESVMHVVSVPQDVYASFPDSEIKKLCLNNEELSSLVRFISYSFYKDTAGNIQELKKGTYDDSQFYTGVGDYHLMNTCNKWTAKGLKSIGMDIATGFKLTAGSIIGYLDHGTFCPDDGG